MKHNRIFITGMGVISPLGKGISETRDAIISGNRSIRPLGLFPVANSPLSVGETCLPADCQDMPRTHVLALIAAREAMGNNAAPDAIVMGVITGGMLTTEDLLRKDSRESGLYRYHAAGSVTEYVADNLKCKGEVITVSTACSSGTLALKVAMDLLLCGKARTVLAGGADCLCRLTYYGFNSLQLIDAQGARPFDRDRKGMSVAEGAAMLLLAIDDKVPQGAVAEIRGAGLSCDAYHPASPHPEGAGALSAMRGALKQSGISMSGIDYINLHGTGTRDNDLAEAKAVSTLFGDKMPYLSSIKGACGHSLAAAGAIEAVVSAICIADGIIPANTGLVNPDPDLKITPVMEPMRTQVDAVLSNSFGFGGNNASLVLSKINNDGNGFPIVKNRAMAVLGAACISGAGNTSKTLENLCAGLACGGLLSIEDISENLPPQKVRRLKRLHRMALALGVDACREAGYTKAPGSVFFGTGWGSLSETYDFLSKLYSSNEQFTSPTDFIGSVHNAPAGQAAIWFNSTGANVTVTAGDYSFEQALYAASLLESKDSSNILIIGSDEYHDVLSPVFDPASASAGNASDGGGAILAVPTDRESGLRIFPAYIKYSHGNENIISELVRELGGRKRINERFAVIAAGMPAVSRAICDKQLGEFISTAGFTGKVIDYRRYTGEFASASAIAAVMAIRFVEAGAVPALLSDGKALHLDGKGVLLLGLGDHVTAVEVLQ